MTRAEKTIILNGLAKAKFSATLFNSLATKAPSLISLSCTIRKFYNNDMLSAMINTGNKYNEFFDEQFSEAVSSVYSI